jgi:N-acetylglutamate synthase-like GNAT family acetyltransferase
MSVKKANDPSSISIRPARRNDGPLVLELIEPYVAQRILLPRTLDEIEDLLNNGFVAEDNGKIVGFAALEVYSKKLAEIRSLCVADTFQRSGIGRQLVEACVQFARERSILEVMAITSSEDFFRSCGFDFTLPGEKKAFFLQTRPEP